MHRRVSARVSPETKCCGLPVYDIRLDTRTKSVVPPSGENYNVNVIFSSMQKLTEQPN